MRQVINLKWAELAPSFAGLDDAQRAGKRRNDGPVQVEEIHHAHSGYGLFCCEGARQLSYSPEDADASTFLDFMSKVLRHNLSNWLQHEHVQGTCTVCSFLVMNAVLNVLYWAQQCDEDTPRQVMCWHVHTRPQGENFVVPVITWKSKAGGGQGNSHTVFDAQLLLNFGRQSKVKDSATLQTKYLRMLAQAAWGQAKWKPGHGSVIERSLPNVGSAELPLLRITSHSAKRSACQRIARAGAPWPILMAMQKAENRATALMYQMKESMEYDDFRQLLNAPSALLPTSRVTSNIDVLQAVKTSDARLIGRMMEQV